MKTLLRVASSACAALAVSALPALRQQPSTGAQRGEYLVHSVALCAQCHTPRDAEGRLIASRQLMGGAVILANPFPSSTPSSTWAEWAPRIAGLPGYSREQGVRLLTAGIARDGAPPRLPMPPFRMAREDAEAVVDYLMSPK
jgi:mono/diheme cytochrome c family protein